MEHGPNGSEVRTEPFSSEVGEDDKLRYDLGTYCGVDGAFSILVRAPSEPRAEAVLRIVEQELPESAALLRLSGMEITECISEV